MKEHTHEIGNGIKLTFSKVQVDSINENYGKFSAQLRQTTSKVYPASKGHDSLSDGLFGGDDFGGGAGPYEATRVAFVPVPSASEETLKAINDRLEACAEPTLVRLYDLEPILSDEQRRAMESGLSDMTMDKYRERQIVKDDKDGEPVPWVAPDGKKYNQFAVTKFSKTYIEDQDNRLATWKEKNEERIAVAQPQTQEKFVSQNI